jgi:glycosyltransferase involved in cell wall biosynthesis
LKEAIIMPKPKKVLIFAPFFPPHVGGLETHVYEFAKHLSERKNYFVTVFAPNIPESKELEKVNENFIVVRYPAFMITKASQNPLPKIWNKNFWRLLKVAGKNNPDFVMSRTRFFFSSFLALLYAKAEGKKYIHVEHGSAFVDMRSKAISFFSYAYDKTLGQIIFHNADKVVPISHAVEAFINREFLPNRRLEVIYRGIELGEMNRIKPDLKFNADHECALKLCMVGRLTKNKGVNIALAAFKELPEEYRKEAKLFIIGDGPDEESLRKLSRGEKNIIFLGRVERKKAWSLLQTMDIFLNPAVSSGGLSTSLLEAMYYGLPVISTKYDGGGDVILDCENGLMVEDNSVGAVKDAIVRLAEDERLRVKLEKNAAKYVRENFQWGKVIDRYEKVFEELTLSNHTRCLSHSANDLRTTCRKSTAPDFTSTASNEWMEYSLWGYWNKGFI